jgi:hypothetical protein
MEEILYRKSLANNCESASYLVLLGTRKVIASFDFFQAFPACCSYESGIVVEKTVEHQNDRIECTHKPMRQEI